jgi:hypothetical protein
MRQQEVN